jgi:hypothetical protein
MISHYYDIHERSIHTYNPLRLRPPLLMLILTKLYVEHPYITLYNFRDQISKISNIGEVKSWFGGSVTLLPLIGNSGHG